MTDWLHYPSLMEDALRGLVVRVLDGVAQHGLPEGHALYLAFKTWHPEVEMPAWLRVEYPDEMTIVLEQQFWDLEVGLSCFGVTLRFHLVPYGLRIPFAALTTFADQPVGFALRFDAAAGPPAQEAPRLGPRRVEPA